MTRSLGIDVGAWQIRVAEIESHGKQRRLIGLYEIPRAGDATPAALLRQFFESSGIVAERIGIGTGQYPLILRGFEFPFGALKKVEAAIQAEFEDTLPFDIGNHVLEVRPLGRDGKNHRFLGGLIPRDSVGELDKLSEDAGILINAYFPDTEALAQLALNQSLPAANSGADYAVCDLGFTTTKLAFLRGSRPRFLNRKAKEVHAPRVLDMRTIFHGSQDLIQWIREKNGLSIEDTLQWLLHRAEVQNGSETAPGGESSLTGDISDDIKNALRPIVVELYQTIQAFRARTGNSPTAVYLTGGLSGLRGLREFLSQELRVPFHPWPIFEGFETGALPVPPEKERSFAVALAIAHRWAYSVDGGWLNFKRMTAQRKLLSSMIATFAQPDLKSVLTGTAVTLAAFFAYGFGAGIFLDQQSSRVQNDLVGEFRKIDRELGKRAQKFAQDPKKANEVFQQERRKKMNEQSAQNNAPTSRARSEIMLDVSEVLPQGVTLKSVIVAETNPGLPNFESTYAVTENPTPEQMQKSLETLGANLRARGYTDVALDTSLADRRLLVLKAKWKGVPQ